ncbi:MAG: hypothetical protein ACJ76H_05445 [Bacteriovoracaceae bacterium]
MRLFLFLLISLSVCAQESVPTAPATPATPFSRMLIVSDMTLIGFEWKDLNLERESQFTAPLLRSWEKWLKEHTPKTGGAVEICEGACFDYLKSWEEKRPEDVSSTVDPAFQNVLWVKVGLNLRRSVVGNIQKFSWDGRVLLLDGNTKRSFANLTLPREEKEWMHVTQSEVNTQLVSRVYRTPMGVFPQLIEKADSALPLNRVIRLVITGQKNMGDVTKLVDLLQTRGSSLGLQVEMSEFGPKEAAMKAYFRGEEKSFTDFLSQVKELKSSYNYSLVNEVTPGGIVIRMVKK